MSDPTAPTVQIPQPTSGPAARLQFNDPTTLAMMAAVLYALGAQLWHSVTGLSAPPLSGPALVGSQ